MLSAVVLIFMLGWLPYQAYFVYFSHILNEIIPQFAQHVIHTLAVGGTHLCEQCAEIVFFLCYRTVQVSILDTRGQQDAVVP
jgi:hypothetical protein